MTDLVTTRWTRYGKDRLYVKTSDGIEVGNIDLLSGTIEVKVAEFDREVRALAPHPAMPDAPLVLVQVARVGDLVDEPVIAQPAGLDLIENRAGAAARAKRNEINAQAPVWNLVARAIGVKTDERNWRVGYKGEVKVGNELAKLPDGWHVIHAVPIGEQGSDIDHIVICPRGVFTLNTKNHPDGAISVYERAVWVNGHSTDYLRNSRFEAKRVSKILTAGCGVPVEVQAALVFVDPSKLTRKGTPPDVHVITRRTLRTFLMQQPLRLTASQVEHIFSVARDSATWQPATVS
jgi:hypothetical protein